MAVRATSTGFMSVRTTNPFASGGQYGRPSRPSGGGGGRSSGGGGISETSVDIRGNEIFINGQGFSIQPGKQAEFLASRGLSGASYQQALERAKQVDAEYKRQQEIKRAFDIKQQQVQQQQAFAKYQQEQAVIEAKQVSFFRDETTGKKVPVREFVFKEPQFQTTAIGRKFVGYAERPATQEEINLYKQDEKSLSLERGTASVNKTNPTLQNLKGGVYNSYEEMNTQMMNVYTKPVAEQITKRTGLTIDKAKQNIKESTQFLISKGVNKNVAYAGEYIASFGVASIENVKYKPLKYVTLAGIGVGAGAVIGGITAGASAISPVAGSLTNIAVAGAGISLFGKSVYETKKQITSATDRYEKSALSSDFTLSSLSFGLGTAGGLKLFKVGRGIYQTRGREFVETKQGDYPQAPTKTQLGLFKKNVLKELGDLPGGFHTTSSKFWKKAITPQAGTSELPGLYISTQVSRPFARISGSGKTPKLTEFWKSLTQPNTSPAIAFIQPKGFRYSPTIKSFYKIGEQSFKRAFKLKTQKGIADVPGLKTEIEAILRPKSGSYAFESGKFYTKIKGVRVPIDTFKYGDTATATSSPQVSKLLGSSSGYSSTGLYQRTFFTKGMTSKEKSSSINYSIPKSTFSSPVSSTSSITSSRKSYRGSSRSSPSSSSPSYSSVVSSGVGSSLTKSSSKPSYSYRPRGKSSSSIFRSSYKTTSNKIFGRKQKPYSQPKQTGSFSVFLRRRGQFKQVGVGESIREAFGIGEEKARTTLGRTFKVTGDLKGLKVPRGFYSKLTKKGETVFIQKAKYSLGTASEKREIREARKLKRKTKR